MPNIRDRIVELRRIPAGELKENPKNYRPHPERQRRALKAVLDEIGLFGALVARETETGYELIDGHLRKDIAPEETLPVLVVDLTQAEADMALATLDPIGAMAGHDSDRLAELLEALRPETEAFEALANQLGKPLNIRDEEALTKPNAARVKAGEIWSLGQHRVACASASDARVVAALTDGEPIDFVFTSPPYNIGLAYETFEDVTVPWETYRDFLADCITPWLDHLGEGRAVAWNIGTSPKTFSHRQYCLLESLGLTYLRTLIWQKCGVPVPLFTSSQNIGRARAFAPNYTHELVAVFAKGPGLERGEETAFDLTLSNDVFQIQQSLSARDLPDDPGAHPTGAGTNLELRARKAHPAPFPVRLPASFIAHLADVGAVVADPFLGSGSTLIAAEETGRKCIGTDVSPSYIDLVISRWESLTGNTAVKVGG